MAESPQSAEEVIALSGKPKPNLLYLGTASYDHPHNARVGTENYAALGCSVHMLNVSWTAPSQEDLSAAFDMVDIILIAGGNTLFAVDRWTRLGMDAMIKSAALDRNVVVAGGSAGFISLCNGGHSDSMKPESYKNPPGPILNPRLDVRDSVDQSWEYIRVPGLGKKFLEAIVSHSVGLDCSMHTIVPYLWKSNTCFFVSNLPTRHN